MNPLSTALALLLCLMTPMAAAEKPAWAGGKHGKGDPEARQTTDRGTVAIEIRIGAREREIIGAYYQQRGKSGKCPPGLAKKGNGCMPPGQAKRWRIGQTLPGDLEIQALPHELALRLPPPPAGHRYVQIAADILLVAIGTSLVVDAVEDLLR